MICTFISDSPEKTLKLGYLIGSSVEKGSIVVLDGDYGCGKTLLAKGVAKALHISPSEVTSPSFTIIHEYENMVHIDLYRVDCKSLYDIGIEEILCDDEKVKVVEWMKSPEIIENTYLPVVKVKCRILDEFKREFAISDEKYSICKKIKMIK